MTCRTVTGTICDFYKGETLGFQVTVSVDDVAQDISSDTVTAEIFENLGDASPLLTQDLDVSTSGEEGTAIAKFTPTQSDTIAVGDYWLRITWFYGVSDNNVLYSNKISSLQ